jgi:hypothetical protein
LFFGAPVTQTVTAGIKGVMNMYTKAVNAIPKYKGVSPGGEEFIVKLDRSLKGKKRRPLFMKGTVSDLKLL